MLDLRFLGSSNEPTSPLNAEGITVTKLPNGSAEVTCTATGQSCLALFPSTNSPTSLDSMVVGFIEPPNDRTTVTLNATSDVYVVVYTWNSDSGETIFDGKVSFVSQLELPTSKPRVSFSFRIVCALFFLLQKGRVSFQFLTFLAVAGPLPTQSPPDNTRSPSPIVIIIIGRLSTCNLHMYCGMTLRSISCFALLVIVVTSLSAVVVVVLVISCITIIIVYLVKRYRRDRKVLYSHQFER